MEITITASQRLFYRLRLQAMIQDLRRRFGDTVAFEIIADAVQNENRVSLGDE